MEYITFWKEKMISLITEHPVINSMFLKCLATILILVATVIAVKFSKIIIKKFFKAQARFTDHKRSDTLSGLCSSILKYVIYFIAIITILQNVFGVNITALITAAGVGGLAIGFGAQSLVKDIISGFFILFENQFSVGDTVTIDGLTGSVQKLELRTTKLQNFTGDVYIIPNGTITKIINHTKNDKLAIVDVIIPYNQNVDNIIGILNEICDSVETDTMIERPTVLGVTEFTNGSFKIRITAKTSPAVQSEFERKLRKDIKLKFEQNQILMS